MSWAIVGLVIVATATPARALELPECVNVGVVMVTAAFGSGVPAPVDSDDGDGASSASVLARGAGVIVKIEDEQVIVVVARHVVKRDRDGVVANHINVRFRRRVTEVPATIMDVFPNDDVAVLRVAAKSGIDRDSLCKLRELNELREGESLFYVGHPQSEPWAAGDSQVAGFEVGKVVFRIERAGAPGVTGGFSGGALYDAHWHLVGLIVTANTPAKGSALSFRGIDNTLRSTYAIETDLRLEDPPRAVLFEVGLAASFGGDPYVTPRFPALVLSSVVELTGVAIGAGRLLLAGGLEGIYAARDRARQLNDSAGQPVTTGSREHEIVIGGSALLRLQLQCPYAAVFGEFGPAVNHFSEGNISHYQLPVVLSAGLAVRAIPVGHYRISVFGRVRATFAFSHFEVSDYHFTLAGAPGTVQRALDDPWFVVIGTEVAR